MHRWRSQTGLPRWSDETDSVDDASCKSRCFDDSPRTSWKTTTACTEIDEISDTEISSKDGFVSALQDAATPGRGLSGFATVMLRNIPYRYSQHELMRELDRTGFEGTYDFLYLPMSTRSKSNRGFAFIHFVAPELAEKFYEKYHGHFLRDFCEPTCPPLTISPAHMQGFDECARYARSQQKLNAPWLRPELHCAQSPRRLLEPESPQEIARTRLRPEVQPSSPSNDLPSRPLQSYGPRDVAERVAQQFCAFCGGRLPATGRFCPYCGRQYGAHP